MKKKTGTIRGGFGLGTSLQYGVMVRPYETFSHYHDSYFMTHRFRSPTELIVCPIFFGTPVVWCNWLCGVLIITFSLKAKILFFQFQKRIQNVSKIFCCLPDKCFIDAVHYNQNFGWVPSIPTTFYGLHSLNRESVFGTCSKQDVEH